MSALGKICVVAGAGPGMGYAIARRFAREGFDIALLARDRAALDVAVESLREGSTRAEAFPVDLSIAADVHRVFASIQASLGHPSVVVYNAARWNQRPAMSMSAEAFAADLSLSIVGALASAQAVYPAMRDARTGTLLFTGGGLALRPQQGVGVASLTAGKSGLRGLVYALNGELASDGIRVATVTISGVVAAGTRFDPDAIAEAYWRLHADPQGPVEIVFDGLANNAAT